MIQTTRALLIAATLSAAATAAAGPMQGQAQWEAQAPVAHGAGGTITKATGHRSVLELGEAAVLASSWLSQRDHVLRTGVEALQMSGPAAQPHLTRLRTDRVRLRHVQATAANAVSRL
ncbi:MAG: hypothetical protein AAGI15_07940 [Pseudomonadota bacterium]